MDGVKLLALLTLISNLFLAGVIFSYLLKVVGKAQLWNIMYPLLSNRAVLMGLLVSLTATLGSLYFSEKRGFTPCILCWYQRILMYPQVALFATALYLKKKDIYQYILPISIFGFLIAGYHYYLQNNPNAFAPCSAVGFSVSCSERYSTTFGYITIPFMSLSAFALIITFMLIQRCMVLRRS